MNKKYTLMLLTVALSATASAAGQQVAKYIKLAAPSQAARPVTDYTGASADSIISYNDGVFVGDLLTDGDPYLKTVTDRTDTSMIVTKYYMELDQWLPYDRIETLLKSDGTQVVTDFYYENNEVSVPLEKQYIKESEGYQEVITERYLDGEWRKTDHFISVESPYQISEEASYFGYDGELEVHLTSMVFFDENGQVERQDYNMAFNNLPELSINRTLIGSYSEDGSIHTLQDDYSKFEIESINSETHEEVLRIYERRSLDAPFELQVMQTQSESGISISLYENGALQSYENESEYVDESYEGLVIQYIFTEFDTETGDVVGGSFDLNYYPDPDNEELIEKKVSQIWAGDYNPEDPWVLEMITEYKYFNDYLCQEQFYGPILFGDKNYVLYGYDQYYYSEIGLGIRPISSRQTTTQRNFDLMGRRIAEKQAGLRVSNGKLTYSAE